MYFYATIVFAILFAVMLEGFLERFGRFGLKYCDLNTMIWNINFFLRTLTLNVDRLDTRRIPIIFYITTLILSVCYFYVFLFCVVWLVWRAPQTGEWLGAIIVSSLAITGEISVAKIFNMFINIRAIRELVDLYRACDSMVEPGSEFHENLMKRLKIVKRRAVFFWMAIIGNGIVYLGKPFYKPGRHLAEDSFTLYGLEPTYETPYFEIVSLIMSLGIIFIVYPPAIIGAFLIMITGYSEAQMIALSEEMTNVWSNAKKHCQEVFGDDTSIVEGCKEISEDPERVRVMNEYVKRRLRDLIKIHTVNIQVMQKVENVYRGTIAVEFLLLTIGIIVELLGRLENTVLQIPFAMVQVAMDCYSGQRVMDASVIFENAVYDSKWENFNLSNRKTVLLMLQMSQKTLKLSAGGVTMLSIMSFGGVLRIIYSSYTALRRMY